MDFIFGRRAMKYRRHILVRDAVIAALAGLLIAAMLMPGRAFAEGITNGSGSGGSGQGGTIGGNSFFTAGEFGIRVTITSRTGAIEAAPVDIMRQNPGGIKYSFGKVCALSYIRGQGLSQQAGWPGANAVNSAMPIFMSNSYVGNQDTAGFKAWTKSENFVGWVALLTGWNADTIMSGNYKLFVEPLIAITYGGSKYIMTAYEASLIDDGWGGRFFKTEVAYTIGNLLSVYLPVSMYLERDDGEIGLGAPPWPVPGLETGADWKNENVRIATWFIKGYLGRWIVEYPYRTPEIEVIPDNGAAAPGRVPDAEAYRYHTNTDVITGVWIKNIDGGIDVGGANNTPATVRFSFGSSVATKTGVVIPKGGNIQRVWFKWHTPSAPGTVAITVNANAVVPSDTSSEGQRKGNKTITVTAYISELSENTPPNPTGTDSAPYLGEENVNTGFTSVPPTKALTGVTSRGWHIWRVNKVGSAYNWYTDNYTATLSAANVAVTAGPNTPTAENSGKLMKSGYGVQIAGQCQVTTTGSWNDVTPIQNGLVTFPEFGYTTYSRLAALTNAVLSDPAQQGTMRFSRNKYSIYEQASSDPRKDTSRVHFTPVWYPDDRYEVYASYEDAWTPVGELYYSAKDSLEISGSVYDDWHVAPKSAA
jgi:hypothetical protein